MSARRAALLAKFRSRAIERAGELVAACAGGAAPERWAELLGDLHTIKGEARMLGLASLSSVAHAIEARLVERTPTALSRGQIGLEHLLALLEGELDENDTARAAAALALAALEGEESRPVAPAERPRGDERLIEVHAAQLDALCDQLEGLRATVARLLAPGAQAPERSVLEDLLSRLDRASLDASELRLAPLEPMLATLAAHARELAASQGKAIDVQVDAQGAELERGVLDALQEPLLHSVRNAIDHGLERPGDRGHKPAAGRLRLQARTRGDGVTLDVSDDGPGLDPDALRRAAAARGLMSAAAASALSDDEAFDLVFRTGLTTRASATDVSGRGVGLDVVRRVVESLGGSVAIASRPGAGCTLSLSVPVGLARERVLVVDSGELRVGIPSRQVLRVVPLAGAVETVGAGSALRLDDEHILLGSLGAALGRVALAVEPLRAEHAVRRRPADAPLAALGLAAASAVTDDGRPVLLPALSELVRRARDRRERRPAPPPKPVSAERALVVDDSPVVRELLAELLTAAGLTVTQAADGEEALERAAQAHFDLVLSDVEMPRMDGFTLVERLRQKGVTAPIVVVTTRGSTEDRKRAAQAGADAYVVKDDFREGELVRVVRQLLGGGA